VKGYEEINVALEEIANNIEQKPCQEARGLAHYMDRLETGDKAPGANFAQARSWLLSIV
jgi:hypothetical protein